MSAIAKTLYYIPNEKALQMGRYRFNGEVWEKLCNGPAHDEPEFLPCTDKYYYFRKSGRVGTPSSRCRLCANWNKLKVHGSHHGLLPADRIKPFLIEAQNRVGLMEVARRTGITYWNLRKIIMGERQFIRKANARKIMLELTSMQRKNENTGNARSGWRTARRNGKHRKFCKGCGTIQENYTDNCGHCQERKKKRKLRKTP